MAEWRVSLWIKLPLSRMNPRTQVRPPASNTAPASLVQISSRTFMHCSAKSLAVLDSVKSAMTNLEKNIIDLVFWFHEKKKLFDNIYNMNVIDILWLWHWNFRLCLMLWRSPHWTFYKHLLILRFRIKICWGL